MLGGVNRARATLDARRRELLAGEGRAEFAAEFALLGQAVTGALAAADTPERCDEQLGRLLLQLEELEARFGEFDDFLAELAAKREEVYEAFAARKQALLDERARRADRLAAPPTASSAASAGAPPRWPSLDELNTYFAADPMVAKLRGVADELRALGDPVRAEELDGRVKAARQEARPRPARPARPVRRRRRDDPARPAPVRGQHPAARPDAGAARRRMALRRHRHRLPLPGQRPGVRRDPRVLGPAAASPRSPEVYRAEYLAASPRCDRARPGGPAPTADAARRCVRQAAEAALRRGLRARRPRPRRRRDPRRAAAPARRARACCATRRPRAPPPSCSGRTARTRQRARPGPRRAGVAGPGPRHVRPGARDSPTCERGAGRDAVTVGPARRPPLAGEYLVEELAGRPAASSPARRPRPARQVPPALGPARRRSTTTCGPSATTWPRGSQLVEALADVVASATGADIAPGDLRRGGRRASSAPTCPGTTPTAPLTATVDGLLGAHPRITGRKLDRPPRRVPRPDPARSATERVPAYRAYQQRRTELVAAERARLRLDEYRPKVMTSFVRNRLIDEVYLPLIGDNLAKQLGAAGEDKRTDQMGMLLLISPPGYGKTTLMEYVASRLGLVFVKVNGPALGHERHLARPGRGARTRRRARRSRRSTSRSRWATT